VLFSLFLFRTIESITGGNSNTVDSSDSSFVWKISVGILVGETIPDRENSRFMVGFPLSRDNFYSFTKRKFSLALGATLSSIISM